MTPEGKVKEKVKKLLRKYNAYWHMPVMNGMGEPTLDFICCVKGYYLAIETKSEGKKPTPRQLVTMGDMKVAGAFVFVVSCDEDLNKLEAHLALFGS